MAEGDDWRFYELWINDVARLREGRRQTTNFFLSLNLAGSGALGFVLNPTNAIAHYYILIAVPAMWLVNLSWIASDRWYLRLTLLKLHFLQLLEKDLPRQPLTDEFARIDQKKPPLWWTILKWLEMESLLPVLFSTAYLIVGLVVRPWQV